MCRGTPCRLVGIALILAAFALRLHRLDAQSLWYDEGVTATVAQYDLGTLTRWTANDIQPPLYYYVVAGWGRLAGWSEWSLRFPSVLFGVLLVVLLVALAHRLGRPPSQALAAGLLAALHPLWLYYSQEARMYMQLLALGVAAALLLERGFGLGAGSGTGPGGSWKARWAFVLAGAAAAYTHYFAFFLLLALVPGFLLRHRGPIRAAPWAWLRPLLGAFLAILLLYLPWVGVLLTQLQVDTSYWEGPLKLWEALRHVATRFTSGETVREPQAVVLLGALHGPVTLLALLRALGSRERRPAALYALLWLGLPVLAILALAATTPKFNPRYAMVALPGLILLWSLGLVDLLPPRGLRPPSVRLAWHMADEQEPLPTREEPLAPSPSHPLLRFLGLLPLLALLGAFLHADRNWFVDPAFTKDQWRELAAYVRAQRSPDEAVVLVSGHAWPVWRYYAPDIPALRLPPLEILDVNAVLDFDNTGPALAAGLAESRGAWLVAWQDEVVDPMGVVPLQLELAGQEEPVAAAFWGLRLRRFTGLDPQAFAAEPPVQVPDRIRFGSDLSLLGHRVMANGDLLLFWRLDAPTWADYRRALETRTPDGFLYHRAQDGRLSAYTYPTFRWKAGQTTVARIPGQDWAGEAAAPGRYTVQIQVYDPTEDLAGLDVFDRNGRPLGKQASLAVRLSVALPAPPDQDPTQTWHPLTSNIYVDARLGVEQAAPGARLPLEIRWYAPQDTLVRHWFWTLQELSARPESVPLSAWQPLDLRLPGGGVVRTVQAIQLPPDAPAGELALRVGLPEVPETALTLPLRLVGPVAQDPPPVPWPLEVRFGDRLLLVGIGSLAPSDLAADPLPPGPISLELVWQSQALLAADLNVTVQWLGPDGRPAAQRDAPLTRREDPWPARQVVRQDVAVPVPPRPGTYTLILAVYDPYTPGLPRLPLADGRDALVLGRWTVDRSH